MTYPTIGDISDYDGDEPVWTLHFDAEVAERAAVESRLGHKLVDTPFFEWTTPRCLHVSMGELSLSPAKWRKLYDRVAKSIDATHAHHPLQAVVICDTDSMASASPEALRLYLELSQKRGRAKKESLCDAISSGDRGLEDLALKHARALVAGGELQEFAGQSADHLFRAQSALSGSLRTLAFDYGKAAKAKAFNNILSAVSQEFVTAGFAQAVAMAAVRDVRAMRSAQAQLHQERPGFHSALMDALRAQSHDMYAVALAFALADSDAGESLAHIRVAQSSTAEAKSKLWREIIPAALESLRLELTG